MKLVDKQYYHNRNITYADLSMLEQSNIPYYAFYKCSNLSNVIFSQSISSIDRQAFSFCRNLTNIALPKNLQKIDDFAFEYCENLLSIEIPSSVKYIGDGAFEQCSKLKDIVIRNDINCYIHPCAFINCKNAYFIYGREKYGYVAENMQLSTINQYLQFLHQENVTIFNNCLLQLSN